MNWFQAPLKCAEMTNPWLWGVQAEAWLCASVSSEKQAHRKGGEGSCWKVNEAWIPQWQVAEQLCWPAGSLGLKGRDRQVSDASHFSPYFERREKNLFSLWVILYSRLAWGLNYIAPQVKSLILVNRSNNCRRSSLSEQLDETEEAHK